MRFPSAPTVSWAGSRLGRLETVKPVLAEDVVVHHSGEVSTAPRDQVHTAAGVAGDAPRVGDRLRRVVENRHADSRQAAQQGRVVRVDPDTVAAGAGHFAVHDEQSAVLAHHRPLGRLDEDPVRGGRRPAVGDEVVVPGTVQLRVELGPGPDTAQSAVGNLVVADVGQQADIGVEIEVDTVATVAVELVAFQRGIDHVQPATLQVEADTVASVAADDAVSDADVVQDRISKADELDAVVSVAGGVDVLNGDRASPSCPGRPRTRYRGRHCR